MAIGSELDQGFAALSIVLLFLSLLTSVGALAWKAFFYSLLREEGAAHREMGLDSMLAYLFLLAVLLR